MATITLPSPDTTKFCRFCLSEINLLNVIGPDATEQEAHGELLRLVKSHLKLELVPAIDFPSAVCEMCIALLHDFDTLLRNVHDYRYAVRILLEAQTKEDVESVIPVTMIEPNLVEVYEPPPVAQIDTGNELIELKEDLDDQTEQDAYGEANEHEAQIDVYHVDGQLQHIVMEGGTYIDLQPFVTPQQSQSQPPPPLQLPQAQTNASNLLNASLPSLGSPISNRKRNGPANNSPAGTAQPPKKFVPTDHRPQTAPPPIRMLNSKPRRTPQPAWPQVQQIETPATKLYRCPKCMNLFVELNNFYSHKCSKLPQQHREIVINSGSSSAALMTTQQTVSAVTITSEGQRFQCNLCDASYRTKLQYQKHEYEVHRISNENFGIKCDICQKLFSQRQDYQLHMQAIHPKPGVSFVKIHRPLRHGFCSCSGRKSSRRQRSRAPITATRQKLSNRSDVYMGPSRPFNTTAILSCFTTRSITSRALVLGVTRSFRDVPLGKPVSYAAYTCRILVALVAVTEFAPVAAASVVEDSGVLVSGSMWDEGTTDCSTVIATELGVSGSGAETGIASRGMEGSVPSD
uniref:Uncharacterized protein n=1 Tax=Anopheles epiroticus TaxID=199890 RepID=A0A182PSI2_9DIPT